MPQMIERDSLSPTAKQQPADSKDTPPRKMTEQHLQIDEQFTDLHVNIHRVEGERKIKIESKERNDDARKIQMKDP